MKNMHLSTKKCAILIGSLYNQFHRKNPVQAGPDQYVGDPVSPDTYVRSRSMSVKAVWMSGFFSLFRLSSVLID